MKDKWTEERGGKRLEKRRGSKKKQVNLYANDKSNNI